MEIIKVFFLRFFRSDDILFLPSNPKGVCKEVEMFHTGPGASVLNNIKELSLD